MPTYISLIRFTQKGVESIIICRLTAVVCAPGVPLTAGRARWARPEANVRCACAPAGVRRAGLGA